MAINATDAVQISRRYATAIFSLALEAKKEAEIVAEIQVIAAAIAENDNLKKTLASPLVTAAQKTEILSALITKASPLTQRAIATISEGNRAALIPTIAAELHTLLVIHQGEAEAHITSARPLNAATQKQLTQALTEATGKTIRLTLAQDERVLGGLKIELGSLRLDATLAGALTRMREQLLASTN